MTLVLGSNVQYSEPNAKGLSYELELKTLDRRDEPHTFSTTDTKHLNLVYLRW